MRKNVLRTFFAAVLISTFFSVSAWAESAVVTGNEVNLRSGPGTNYRVIDCLTRGNTVTVTDRSNSSWYAVDYNGQSGFMAAAYLDITEDIYSNVVANSGDGNGYINAMYVRFRSGPSSSSSILGEYNRGKAVTITGTSGDWTACTIDGRAGYIYSQYITTGESYSGYNSGVDVYLSQFTGVENSNPLPTQSPVYPGTDTGYLDPPQVTASPITPAPTPELVPTEEQAGYINADSVRFRTGPSTSYSIIDTYNAGTAVTVTGTSGDWTACTINGQSGFVFTRYITLSVNAGISIPQATQSPELELPQITESPSTQVEGYITGNNVRMRSGASMNSQILCELFYGNAVTITGTYGDWTAIIYNGTPGYVYAQYVKEGSYSNTVSPGVSGSVEGKQIADFALQFVGYNYCWGGKSPETGFDCSGLVYYTYAQFGYTLNRVAADQARNGVHVDPSDLQPGDIICFYSGGDYIGHVGIYIGDNKFVHAQNSATGVVITALEGYYATRGYEARRIIA